jgi:hypothetical protein
MLHVPWPNDCLSEFTEIATPRPRAEDYLDRAGADRERLASPGRGMRVDDVVGALVARHGLEQAQSANVKRYYQRLEGGPLDPRGLSGKLRTAIEDTLRAGVEAAVSWTAPPGRCCSGVSEGCGLR